MKEIPKVLVVDNSRAVTGALNAMRHATTPLRATGLSFTYVLPSGSTARAVLEADGYVVHELPFVEISRRKADLLRLTGGGSIGWPRGKALVSFISTIFTT
jgi:hypothetical protein